MCYIKHVDSIINNKNRKKGEKKKSDRRWPWRLNDSFAEETERGATKTKHDIEPVYALLRRRLQHLHPYQTRTGISVAAVHQPVQPSPGQAFVASSLQYLAARMDLQPCRSPSRLIYVCSALPYLLLHGDCRPLPACLGTCTKYKKRLAQISLYVLMYLQLDPPTFEAVQFVDSPLRNCKPSSYVYPTDSECPIYTAHYS
jgi:hypothetical protein